MGFLDTIADLIWARIKPEVDEMQVIAQQQLDQWRTDAMAMLSEALPEMAGKIAEQAVLTVFDKTQVDEAANAVSGAITDIIGRLPRFPFIGGH